MSKHVTSTGRAISAGRVTRRQHSIRAVARKQEKPLPIWLQCHPMAQSPTPLNPECKTVRSWGAAYMMHRGKRAVSYMAGAGLQEAGRFTLYVQGEPVGYVNNPQDGLGWIRAAAERDVVALMFDTQE